MILRRIRAILVTAAVCGTIMTVVSTAVGSLFFLDPEARKFRADVLSDVVGSVPYFFREGALIGALLAILLMVAERRQTIETISSFRFRLWGGIAGAVPMIVSTVMTHTSGTASAVALKSANWSPFIGAVLGWHMAAGLLWVMRRGTSASEERSPGPATG